MPLPNGGCFADGSSFTPRPEYLLGHPNWQSAICRIQSWSWVTSNAPTAELLKNALFTYGPLVTTLAVYRDFYCDDPLRSSVQVYLKGSGM